LSVSRISLSRPTIVIAKEFIASTGNENQDNRKKLQFTALLLRANRCWSIRQSRLVVRFQHSHPVSASLLANVRVGTHKMIPSALSL
jgi:hypothetical protein